MPALPSPQGRLHFPSEGCISLSSPGTMYLDVTRRWQLRPHDPGDSSLRYSASEDLWDPPSPENVVLVKSLKCHAAVSHTKLCWDGPFTAQHNSKGHVCRGHRTLFHLLGWAKRNARHWTCVHRCMTGSCPVPGQPASHNHHPHTPYLHELEVLDPGDQQLILDRRWGHGSHINKDDLLQGASIRCRLCRAEGPAHLLVVVGPLVTASAKERESQQPLGKRQK